MINLGLPYCSMYLYMGGVYGGLNYYRPYSFQFLRYRRFHAGIDIGGGTGDPIFAAADGVVVRAGPATGYGCVIVIDHGGGLQTVYAHMYPHWIKEREGLRFKRGQYKDAISSNGWSTGPHLHFEV